MPAIRYNRDFLIVNLHCDFNKIIPRQNIPIVPTLFSNYKYDVCVRVALLLKPILITCCVHQFFVFSLFTICIHRRKLYPPVYIFHIKLLALFMFEYTSCSLCVKNFLLVTMTNINVILTALAYDFHLRK